jgi:hypothetical protein
MTDADTLALYCNELLSADGFSDYCPNGCRWQATRPVRR